MANIKSLKNAWLKLRDGKIEDYGPMSEKPAPAGGMIDARGGMVLPAWCDSHTHLIYAQNRAGEFVDRIKGLTYEEIAEKGGGILNSAKRLQNTSEQELLDDALERAEEIIDQGTGAVEIKSGYGLTLEAELKMLRVARELKTKTPLTIKTTFLGAHAIPPEYKSDRSGYINLVCDQMIPKVADEGLADYCDVFCEDGYFSVEEAEYILETGQRYGLKPKVHANQMNVSGGVQVGVKLNAISVDHLEQMTQAEIATLQGTKTMPTILPSASFFLNMEYAPARLMMDAGLPLALASDFNPGSTPTGNMQFVISLGCLKCKMLPQEAIAAATLNGAYAMDLQESLGSITRGKQANIILTKAMSDMAEIPYYFGSNHIQDVFLNGVKQ